MYAMLTGALPYTVEPFNITALHAKMLQNKMNPIPSHLTDSECCTHAHTLTHCQHLVAGVGPCRLGSMPPITHSIDTSLCLSIIPLTYFPPQGCRDLLTKMLVSNPEHRITMAEVFNHPWLNENHRLPFQPAPYPNRTTQADIDDDVIEHMVNTLKVADSPAVIKHDLITNKATSNYAVYHLLTGRLARYRREFKSAEPTSRKKAASQKKKVSKDHGYYEDEEDAMSTVTVPGRLQTYPVTRGAKRVSR